MRSKALTMKKNIPHAAQQIKLLILDVDGVLTDGKIYVDPTQESLKAFHVQDGLGIKLLQKSGITVAIITGKESTMVAVRAKTLGIEHVYQNQPNKVAAFESLLEKLSLTPEQVAYVGDDIPDLYVMSKVGLSIAVANAQPIIAQYADLQTQLPGGHGAVREVANLLLNAQGKLASIHSHFLTQGGW